MSNRNQSATGYSLQAPRRQTTALRQRPLEFHGKHPLSEILEVGLPNGNVCYLTSAAMRTIAQFLCWETFMRGQYQRPGFELQAGDTVIDVGANIGMFALWTEPQIPRGRLICIEPNPRALECLRMNVCRKGLHNVIIVPAAAGS